MNLQIEEKISVSPEEQLIHQRKIGAYTESMLARPVPIGERMIPSYLFARDQRGELVGGAYCYSNLGNFMIEVMWVEKECRQQGLGRKLYAAIEDVARKRGCRQIIGSMYGFHHSLEFFLKMGGVRFALLPGVAGGPDIHYVHKVLS